MQTIELDYPVSMNRYWRVALGRVVISPAAKRYKQHILIEATRKKVKPSDKSIYLHIILHPKLSLMGVENMVRIDLDNCAKVVCDGLNGLAYIDDKQITKILLEIKDPKQNGGLTVHIDDA